jgi:Holliday junction resolvase
LTRIFRWRKIERHIARHLHDRGFVALYVTKSGWATKLEMIRD